jgi:monoamine oxidase
MMMLYMDRPSTEFWRHYLSEPDKHDRAEVDQDARIVDAFALFVARDVKRSLETNDAHLKLNAHSKLVFSEQTLAEASAYIKNSIITYGIRDWARAPYGAANHGWQPGVRSWKVMDAFKAFDFGSGAKNVHIVGEAFSDYQGFVEGALNSSELALAMIKAPSQPAEVQDQ